MKYDTKLHFLVLFTSPWKKATTLANTSGVGGGGGGRERDGQRRRVAKCTSGCMQSGKKDAISCHRYEVSKKQGPWRGGGRDKEKAKGRNTERKPTVCHKSRVTGLSVKSQVMKYNLNPIATTICLPQTGRMLHASNFTVHVENPTLNHSSSKSNSLKSDVHVIN
jgi:hypothetical protein